MCVCVSQAGSDQGRSRGIELDKDFQLHSTTPVASNEQGPHHDSRDDVAATSSDVIDGQECELRTSDDVIDGVGIPPTDGEHEDLNQTRLSDVGLHTHTHTSHTHTHTHKQDYDWRQYVSQEDTHLHTSPTSHPAHPHSSHHHTLISHHDNGTISEMDTSTLSEAIV